MTLAERLDRAGALLVALAGSPIPTHIFQTLADQAGGALPGDYLAVCLNDPAGRGYVIHSLAEMGIEAFARRVFAAGEGLPGRAIESGQSVVVDDVSAEGACGADPDRALAERGLRAALIEPMRRGPETLGALLFARRSPRYCADDRRVAALIAAGVAAGIETSRAYQALADERSTLAAVVASTQEAVLVVNEDRMILLANPAVRPMLGLDPDAVLGLRVGDVLPAGPLRALLEAGHPTTADVPLSGGRTAQASVVLVTTPFGEPVGVAAVLRDITLLRTLEQMKTEFVHTVSHDLKNPIFTITGTARLMLEADPGDARQREWCQRVLRASDYMSRLVGDLLDLGRIESGLEAPPEPVDMVAIAREAVAALTPDADAKAVALSADLPDAALVTANPGRMTQAVRNLVANAIAYTKPGGRVAVIVKTADALLSEGAVSPAVVVTVSDTGIGISPAHLPFVFDKFYRATATAAHGTGLGLAIVKSIVEAAGGRAWAESEEGRGSAFSFALPARP